MSWAAVSGSDMRAVGGYTLRVLGCKVNQYEAGQVRQLLESRGFEPGEEALALVVVHGCAVTAEALRKSRRALRSLQREHPGAVVLFSGCSASAQGEAAEALPGCVLAPAGKEWLEHLAEKIDALFGPPPGKGHGACPPGQLHNGLRAGEEGPHRAFLKIQDGCSLNCSYCIVPLLRGPSRDRPLRAILQEARTLVRRGFRECVLSGISIGLYGHDTRCGLADVLRALLDIEGLDRVRMSSLHPSELTDDLLAIWRASPRVMPHIHLPLQSGADPVLKSMRRGYSVAQFEEAVARFRDAVKKPSVTTDVMTGFPGETEEDFESTCSLVERIGFSNMHVFPFSSRPGTPAAGMGNQVAPDVVRGRMQHLLEQSALLRTRYEEGLIDSCEEVLVERSRGSLQEGHGRRYVRIRFSDERSRENELVPVRIAARDRNGLYAVPL